MEGIPPGAHPPQAKSGMSGGAIAMIVGLVLFVLLVLLVIIAYPAFKKYGARAKTTEAPPNLKKIFDGAKGYYESSERANRDGIIRPPSFPPSVGLTPTKPCCKQADKRCQRTNWSNPTWRVIGFDISDPHYFQYRFESSGSGTTARFTAGAHADLDCDGALSTYERTAGVDDQQRVVGAASLFIKDDIE